MMQRQPTQLSGKGRTSETLSGNCLITFGNFFQINKSYFTLLLKCLSGLVSQMVRSAPTNRTETLVALSPDSRVSLTRFFFYFLFF